MINREKTLTRLWQAVRILTCVLIAKVTVKVVLNLGNYFPPDFTTEFLIGRERYFFGSYQWAFYSHIITGPVTLGLGLILLSERFRLRYRRWHRYLGRVQTGLVLFVVFPSGLWMACYAATGVIAGLGFATLAIATAVCAWQGWRYAVRKRFVEHRIWMSRCYTLLCSAVVLRLMGGSLTVLKVEADWTYGATAWASWLIPLIVYEVVRRHD